MLEGGALKFELDLGNSTGYDLFFFLGVIRPSVGDAKYVEMKLTETKTVQTTFENHILNIEASSVQRYFMSPYTYCHVECVLFFGAASVLASFFVFDYS